jgi:hypothetical protein
MSAAHDPLSELTQLMERSRLLLGQLRSLETRIEEVARHIAELSLAQQDAREHTNAKPPTPPPFVK